MWVRDCLKMGLMFTKAFLEAEHWKCLALEERPMQAIKQELDGHGLYKFYRELDDVAKDLSGRRRRDFDQCTKGLIKFLCECDYWGGLRTQQVLVIIFTAHNCARGARQEFPEFALGYILQNAKESLITEIRHAAVNKAQLREALKAAIGLISVLEDGVVKHHRDAIVN